MNSHVRVVQSSTRPRRRLLSVALACASMLAVTAPPTVGAAAPEAGPPDARFVVNHSVGTRRVPVRVMWPQATPGDAPLSRYQLQHRVNEGTWHSITLASALSRRVTVNLRPGSLNQFRVRARDTAGLYGAWAVGAPQWLAVVQEDQLAIHFSAGWTKRSLSSALADRIMSTDRAAALASFDFQATDVAWVTHRASNRGRASVFVGDRAPTLVDLRRSTTQARRIVFSAAWADAAARTLAIETEGTDGRPRVDVDALLTLGPPQTSVLVGAGDIATCDGKGDEATAMVVDAVAGTVFTTGDNAYPSGTVAEFKECYGPSWGRFKSRTRPSAGNHDYRASSTATPYFDYFGANAGARGRGWYAYDAGTWRIYALNSNCAEIGGCGPTSAQYNWLKNDLAANPRHCVAAYWHHARFSSAKHGPSTRMSDILQLLYDNGAELVLAGHDHSYERFAPVTPTNRLDTARGIRHIVVGTGGAPLYEPSPNIVANSEVLETSTHGVLKLTLGWDSYSWNFLPAGEGTFSDSGSDDCH